MANILVVDDHPLSRQSLAAVLSYHGHRVHEATDGVEALEAARKQRPDLIITDPAVLRMGGSGLVRALRADQDLATVPIVFCSAGHRQDASRALATATGVEHVITRPATPAVILGTVHSALGLPRSGSPIEGPDSSAGYIERLQLAGVRMSALIELSLDLSAERDSDHLLSTACRAVRTLLESDYAAIALTDESGQVKSWVDGPVDQTRLEAVVARETASQQRSLRSAEGPSDPLVQVVSEAMPGLHAVLLVPMQAHGRRNFGSILVGRTGESGAYSSDEEHLAVALASEIRAAYENVTQMREQRHPTAERTMEHRDPDTLVENIDGQLSSSQLDLAALFEASPLPMVGFDQELVIRAWNRAAERTFGWSAGEILGDRTSRYIPPASRDVFERLAARCLAGATLTDIQVQRSTKDGRILEVSISMAPLYDAHGHLRGVVSIINDITGRKRSEEELRGSRERLRAMSARVLSIQEDERTRLARELHDDLAQLLTAIKLDAARLVQDVSDGVVPPTRITEGIIPLIDTTLDAVGRIVSELRPSRIGEMGLAAAIEKTLADFQQRTDIECELSIRPETLHIPHDIAAAAFRIADEALTNIARHAGATRAEVRVRQQEEELLLEVRDNGRGIREEEKLAGNAYGIMGMNERAYLFGGSLTITGVEGRGTIVAARIPLERRNGDPEGRS
jgi:PAS domain S-box-containing protein